MHFICRKINFENDCKVYIFLISLIIYDSLSMKNTNAICNDYHGKERKNMPIRNSVTTSKHKNWAYISYIRAPKGSKKNVKTL